ncbi:MAG TPA: hypothetical protein VGZ00_09050 [Candidatus Baltobacteraceae bacterium]|jgi:hypothetical protein|nr:hypothetical protein [Candidatus Baltobacteraceae bacterium]
MGAFREPKCMQLRDAGIGIARALVHLVVMLGLVSTGSVSARAEPAPVHYNGALFVSRPLTLKGKAPPRIQEISLSGKSFHGGDLVRIWVLTSTNVAVLEMRTFGYGRALVKRGYGRFEGVFHVPLLPPLVRVSYPIAFQFIARNAHGIAVEDDATIAVRSSSGNSDMNYFTFRFMGAFR